LGAEPEPNQDIHSRKEKETIKKRKREGKKAELPKARKGNGVANKRRRRKKNTNEEKNHVWRLLRASVARRSKVKGGTLPLPLKY